MPSTRLSAAMEDYLKAIFLLQEEGETVTTMGLATHLKVAAPSVTNMVKRLHELGLVLHSPYRDVELTPAGQAIAMEVIRHHRLLELYLVEFLDVPWEKVHDEAEQLEHVLSEELESRIAAKLGQPAVDPHGHPIPSESGALPSETTVPLWEVPPGCRAVVARVSDRDPQLLTHLSRLGLVPGTALEVRAISPYSGTQTVWIGDTEHVIGTELAQCIRVRMQVPEGAQS